MKSPLLDEYAYGEGKALLLFLTIERSRGRSGVGINDGSSATSAEAGHDEDIQPDPADGQLNDYEYIYLILDDVQLDEAEFDAKNFFELAEQANLDVVSTAIGQGNWHPVHKRQLENIEEPGGAAASASGTAAVSGRLVRFVEIQAVAYRPWISKRKNLCCRRFCVHSVNLTARGHFFYLSSIIFTKVFRLHSGAGFYSCHGRRARRRSCRRNTKRKFFFLDIGLGRVNGICWNLG